MIPKVAEKRNDGRSSFASLGRYVAGEKIDRETGEIVRSAEDVHLETNCLSVKTAAAEMRAVADMNSRVKDPVYHVMLSWRTGEKPTNDQVHEAAMAAMKSVGMQDHQYVLAVHRDTENVHVHMMVNRVNPETYKSVYPEQDFFTLDRCCREIELQQGWEHDNGPHRVVDGQIVRTPREQAGPPLPTKARDMEAATGCESLLSYAQQASGEVVAALEKGSWQDLHAALRQHGLEIREAGQGFKIYDLANPKTAPIKASDMAGALGGGKLKKQLGAFEKPLRVVQAEKPARTYNQYREKGRDSRDERREARAAARLELRQRYESQRTEARATAKLAREDRMARERLAIKELAASARGERDRIRAAGLSETDRKAQLSILAMRTVAHREQIKLASRQAREAEQRMPGYKDWTGQQAEIGDEAAIAQLKGWAYQDSRRRSAAEKAEKDAAERGALRAAQPAQDTPARPVLEGLAWAVDRRTGDVTYTLAGQAALRDTGRQVAVLQPLDDKSIEAGLRLASQKFGPTLTLSGSQEFRQRVIQLAVEKMPGVRFADPVADAYRAQLEQARQAKRQLQENQNGKQHSKSDHRDVWGTQSGRGRGGR